MRQAGEQRVQDIWQAVQQEPGIKAARIAQKLEVPRSSVTRALPALDERGLLLSEDRQGRLWPWQER